MGLLKRLIGGHAANEEAERADTPAAASSHVHPAPPAEDRDAPPKGGCCGCCSGEPEASEA